MYKPNISATEQWVSTIAGAALAIAGYKRKNRLLQIAGLGLIGRGASGFCPVSKAIGRNTARRDTRDALGGSGGVIAESIVTIARPAQEIYSYWRELENLPTFMSHLQNVQNLGGNRSSWTAFGPLGTAVSWEAEIIQDVPPQLISWRTLPGSEVVSAGSVWFKAVGSEHTEVRVKLQYSPPAGKVGATVASLLGEDAQHQIDQDLQRFKQRLEMGALSDGIPYQSAGSRKRGKTLANQLATESLQ